MAVYQLDDDLWFPDPRNGEESGLVAIGGDLSVERLVLAYCNGFFPWYAFRSSHAPHWYCPMDRFVIFPEKIHISHSMKQLMRQGKYHITFNQAFEHVLEGCARSNGRSSEMGAWLGQDMKNAYMKLHDEGVAASLEVWEPQSEEAEKDKYRLVGGLYGVSLRNAFFGESMFSLVPNASKLALICLAKILEQTGGLFIDCQFETPHLKSMGGEHISYDRYMDILNRRTTSESAAHAPQHSQTEPLPDTDN